MHEGVGGGHFGISRVQNKLSGKYYWKDMIKDVRHYVKTCTTCQMKKRSKFNKPRRTLKPIPVPSRIFAQVGMDLIHMRTCKGFNYIITAVDYLTKYCEMRAIREKSAREVSVFIYEELICRWGVSEYHITDQGKEFVNTINKNLLSMCGTKQRITSAYHPQANGLCERLNRSTQDQLRKNIEKEKNWVNMLPTIAFGHRSSMNASTRMSPLEMLMGQKTRVPIDITMKYPTDDDLERDLTLKEVEEIADYCTSFNIEEMKKLKECTIGTAKVNIANAQIRQKRNYDKRFVTNDELKVGDLVIVENQRNKNRKGGKHETPMSGPYRIKFISKLGICTLETMHGLEKNTKHPLGHLQIFNERNLNIQSESSGDEPEEEFEERIRRRCDGLRENEVGKEEVATILDYFDDNGRVDSQKNISLSQKSIADAMGLKLNPRIFEITKRGENEATTDKVTIVEKLNTDSSEDDMKLPDLVDDIDVDEDVVITKMFGFNNYREKNIKNDGGHTKEDLLRKKKGEFCDCGKEEMGEVTEVGVDKGRKERKEVRSGVEMGQNVGDRRTILNARRRLTLKKKNSNLDKLESRGDSSDAGGKIGQDREEVGEYKEEEDENSDDSVIFIPTPGIPGNEQTKFVFLPLGGQTRRRLAGIFGINRMGPLPDYGGVRKNVTKRRPKRREIIEGDDNCLFRAISYSICSSELFHENVRGQICDYIEGNWKEVRALSGELQYKSGKDYLERSSMRKLRVWGGSVELCALSLMTGIDVVTYYKEGYYKFGKNESNICFFLYNPGKHYDVILEP